MSKIKHIGFIGTGVMGKSMAKHLINAGYKLYVYNRTRAKAEELEKLGAIWCDQPAAVASNADAVLTILGYPKDVEQVYFGDGGLFEQARQGTYFIDMTTSKPGLAKTIYNRAKVKQLHALDAPVSGGDIGAREAKLTIMVGGDQEDYEAVLPILQKLGTNIVLQGDAGAGQHTKMCNQIAIASTMMGVCEAMTYAQKAGLNPHRVLQSIETGAAGSWSLSNLAPRMLKEDFAPGFYVKHFIKDMSIAIEAATEMDLQLPGLQLAQKLYKQLAESGGEEEGTQALFKLYQMNQV